MGRFGSVVLVVATFLVLAVGFTSCGSSPPTATTVYPVPAIITLTPATQASVDIGGIVSFSASPKNAKGTVITEPVHFVSSNTSVVTVASNGKACAGTWNSLSSPTVCTPGPAGTALVWATYRGVSSATTTVYVHQHIDKIAISQITTPTTLNTPCLSVGQTADYQANAYNQGVDITSSVGTVAWQITNSTVASVTAATDSNPISGLITGQAEAKAKVPGIASIYASVGGVTSLPLQFITCPVQSIALQVNNTNATSITMAPNGTASITPTILDTLGATITGSFLTFSSSESAAVSITSSGSARAATSGAGAFITATCTPPTCNIGILPTLPVYPESGIHIAVSPSQSSSTAATNAVWVTTTGCANAVGCTTTIVPIKTPDYTVGDSVGLPSTPNSFVFSHTGNRAYLGTDGGALGTRGLMVFVPNATSGPVTQYASVPGKVLAVSDDGSRAIVSDTTDTPNQVYVFDCGTSSGGAATSGACGSASAATLNITGATAAAFSPDGLKAFIVANSGNASTLYIFSTLDALETIPLSTSATANDVAFLPSGSFGYIAGGAPNAVSVVATCHPVASPGVATVATPGTPLMIRALPDGKFMALDPPNVDFITAQTSGSGGCTYSRPYPGATGGPLIPGTLAVSNAVTTTGLGLGNFTPAQLIVSPDASTAYITIATQSHVVVFDILNKVSTGIPLSGGATPLNASLAEDGALLYVGASDGTVHVLDTTLGNDVHQVTFPTALCINGNNVCSPDLIAATR
jgi:hypothetical protein